MSDPTAEKSFMRVPGIDAGPRNDAPPAYLHWIRILRCVFSSPGASHTTVDVKKKCDDTSGRLFRLCISGDRVAQVQIDTLRFERGAFRLVSRWTLGDVGVLSHSVESGGESETFVLGFERITMQSPP